MLNKLYKLLIFLDNILTLIFIFMLIKFNQFFINFELFFDFIDLIFIYQLRDYEIYLIIKWLYWVLVIILITDLYKINISNILQIILNLLKNFNKFFFFLLVICLIFITDFHSILVCNLLYLHKKYILFLIVFYYLICYILLKLYLKNCLNNSFNFFFVFLYLFCCISFLLYIFYPNFFYSTYDLFIIDITSAFNRYFVLLHTFFTNFFVVFILSWLLKIETNHEEGSKVKHYFIFCCFFIYSFLKLIKLLNFTFLLPYIQIFITFILYFTIIYYFIKYNIYLYKNFYKIYILDLSINIILVLLLNYTLYNQKLTLVCINKLFFQNDSNLFLKFILENRMFILCFKFMYICLLNFLLFLVNYITLRGFFKYLYLKVHFFRYFIISIYEYIIFVNNLLKKFFKNYFLYKYFILFIDFLIYYDKIAVPGRYEVYLTIGIVIIFNLLNPFKLNVGNLLLYYFIFN